MSINKAILVGNLGKDPERRFTPSGRAVARFPLATSARWKDADGTPQERTDWHTIVVWGKQAENCDQYLTKGRQVYVEGTICSRSYDDQAGNRHFVTEILAQRVQFLGGGNGHATQRRQDDEQSGVEAGEGPLPDDEIPF